MALETVVLKGKEYPIDFGTWTLRNYEIDSKTSVTEFAIDGSQTAAMIKLYWHGLKQGAKRAKKKFTLSEEALSYLMDDDLPGTLQITNAWLRAQKMPELPTGEEEEKDPDKKKK